MSMKGILLLASGVLLIFCLWKHSPIKAPAAYLTPINFYGRVVDQSGAPASSAKITYRANNRPWGGGSRSKTTTDAKGVFAIRSRGLSLYVEVSKEGYRSVMASSEEKPGASNAPSNSSGTFHYAELFGELVHKPSKHYPTTLTLYKPGVLEPLISPPGKDFLLKKDGTPVRLQLDPSTPARAVEVQCWTQDGQPNNERHYDWRFRVSVPAGGLIERQHHVNSLAPPEGYQGSFEYSMPKELPGTQWKDSLAKSYFVQFDDGTHAILNIRMLAGGTHFVQFGSHLNPKPGSRNLETPPPSKPKWR